MHIPTKAPRSNHAPEYNSPFGTPALREALASRAHAASPRPLARTHDTNTKRNRKRFPGWGSWRILSPQPPINILIARIWGALPDVAVFFFRRNGASGSPPVGPKLIERQHDVLELKKTPKTTLAGSKFQSRGYLSGHRMHFKCS